MANGKHRDSFRTDILNHGIPTFSVAADDLVRQVWRLSGVSEAAAAEAEVEASLHGMATEIWSRWTSQPWVYLDTLDAMRVRALESTLEARLERLRSDARARGWEIP